MQGVLYLYVLLIFSVRKGFLKGSRSLEFFLRDTVNNLCVSGRPTVGLYWSVLNTNYTFANNTEYYTQQISLITVLTKWIQQAVLSVSHLLL